MKKFIVTNIDKFYDKLKSVKLISLSKISEFMKIKDTNLILNWAEILEKDKLININYAFKETYFSMPEIVGDIENEKEKNESYFN